MSDFAEILASEALYLLDAVSAEGGIPRTFVGITQDGRKCLFQPGNALQNADDLGFYRWLCRTQRIEGYFYVTHVGILKDSGDVEEQVAVYASSETLDLTVMRKFERQDDGSIEYTDIDVFRQYPPNEPVGVFLGLQRSTVAANDQEQAVFEKLWQDLSRSGGVTWLDRDDCLW